jgi:hypothetical protein
VKNQIIIIFHLKNCRHMNLSKFYRLRVILILAGVALLLGSCKKTEEETPASQEITSMDDLKVDPSFTFSTSQGVGIAIRMLDNTDGPVEGMRVDVYTDDPEQGGRLMVSGTTDPQGFYRCDYRIPASMKSVAVCTRAIGFPNMQLVNVINGRVKCTMGGRTTPSNLKM